MQFYQWWVRVPVRGSTDLRLDLRLELPSVRALRVEDRSRVLRSRAPVEVRSFSVDGDSSSLPLGHELVVRDPEGFPLGPELVAEGSDPEREAEWRKITPA